MPEDVSVRFVIPYAGESKTRLAETIDSAFDTGCDGVIVVGDGVSLGHMAIGTQADCFFVTKRGVAKALHFGYQIAISQGATHVARLDTGDTVSPDRLECELPERKGQFCLADVDGRIVGDSPDWEHDIWTDNQFCASTTIVPAQTWLDAGGYHCDVTYCSDWLFHARVMQVAGWERLDRALVEAHEYADGLTKGADPAARHRDRARVVRLVRELRARGPACQAP